VFSTKPFFHVAARATASRLPEGERPLLDFLLHPEMFPDREIAPRGWLVPDWLLHSPALLLSPVASVLTEFFPGRRSIIFCVVFMCAFFLLTEPWLRPEKNFRP
jgi:hypothetical protein